MQPMLKLFCALVAVHCITYFCESCITSGDDDLTKVDIQLEHSFELHSFNLSSQSYNLSMIVKWNISKGANITGFLYRFTDGDDESGGFDNQAPIPLIYPGLSPGFSPGFPSGPFGSMQVCDGVTDVIWAVNENGTLVQCRVPCEGIMPSPCLFSKVCRRLKENYISVSKETRTLTLPAEFGRLYDFDIMAYKEWSTGPLFNLNHEKPTLFCRHEMIENYGIDPGVADEFCKHQNLYTHYHSTGPITNLTLVEMRRNMSSNRGVAVFQWQPPHDMHSNVTIDYCLINVLGSGKVKSAHVYMAKDDLYRAVVSDITFGEEVTLKIMPISNIAKCMGCTEYGTMWSETFSIPDIDACVGDDMTERYCDPIADCVDFLRGNATAAANCTCPAGYRGNGISNEFDEGEGCTDFDSCTEGGERNATCVSEAVCTDILPPSLGVTCSCPLDYIGDGYRSGSGCSYNGAGHSHHTCRGYFSVFLSLCLILSWQIN